MSLICLRRLPALALRLVLTVTVAGALAASLTRGGDLRPSPLPVARLGGVGYWLAGAEGGVFAFGGAPDFGGVPSGTARVAAIAGTSSGRGYWLTTATGVVTGHGDAVAHGGLGHLTLNRPIVGMAPTPTGGGYWLVASDGGVFAFGDAGFFGSMGGQPLNKPIVGMTPTASGKGYWFVASDGGLFAFGDAGFFGSMGDKVLNKPVVGMAASRTGLGYRMVAADGGVFSFGDARFYGSTGDQVLNQPITSMAATPSGEGYWFVAVDGGVFSFGDATFAGSAVGRGQRIVGMAAANALPNAVGDAVTLDEDNPVSVDVLANDRNLNDAPITVAISSGPNSGTASVEAGRIFYRPAGDFAGSDQIRYRVTDGDGDSAVATLSLTIRPVNDTPEVSTFGPAGNSGITIDEDTEGTFGFTFADKESPLGTLRITATSSNTTLIPDANITLSGSGVGRTVRVAPAANRNGNATITVRVSDGVATGTGSFSVAVLPVNDAPTISPISRKTIDEDGSTGPVSFTISDPETSASGLTVTAASSDTSVVGQSGITLGGSGANRTVTIRPRANVAGSSFITITVSDGSRSDDERMEVIVEPVNDAPVATDVTLTATEDQGTAATGTVTASDVDDDPVTFAMGIDAEHGTAAVEADGDVTYTPALNYSGPDNFTVTVSDGNGGTDTATVNVNVAAVNDPPTAAGVTLAVTEDQTAAATGQVTASDVDGDTLNYVFAGGAVKGMAGVSGLTGEVTYIPSADQNGTDSFTVTVSDGNGGTDTATVNVNIAAVNDAPDAADLALTTAEDTATAATITAVDVDGDTVTFALSGTAAQHGSAAAEADGDVSYTPALNYNGSDAFSVTASDGNGGTDTATVAVTVTAVNDAPVATGGTLATTEDTPGTVTLTGSDVEGSAITFEIAGNGAKGTAVVDETTGAVTYTPNPNANGADTFTYTVNDGALDSAPATVTVTITPADDVPVAVDDTATTDEDTPVTITVLNNDTGAVDQPVTVTVTSPPASGEAVANADGTVTYTPAPNASGTTTFTYSLVDGNGDSSPATVTVTVGAVDDTPTIGALGDVSTGEDHATAPIDVIIGDVDTPATSLTVSAVASDPAKIAGFTYGGSGSGRTLVVTPKADATGTVTITVTVSDGHSSASEAFVLTITPADDIPTASDDSATTAEDNAVSVNVLANDSGLGDGGLAVTITTPPATGGTAAVNPDGSVTFTPTPDFSGTATFSYTVTDGDGQSDAADVTVTVNAVNDAPTLAAIGNVSTNEDTATAGIGLTVGDIDNAAGSLTLTATADPALVEPAGFAFAGTDAARSLVITPKSNANGTTVVTVTVSDGALTASQAFTLTVQPTQDPPVLVDLSFQATEDQPFTGALTGSDPDGEALSFTVLTPPSHGSITAQSSGAFTYVPHSNYTGTDSFTFQASDGKATASATATIDVANVNDAPLAVVDVFVLGPLGGNIDVRLNDTDIDNAVGALTVSIVEEPSSGVLVCGPNGKCTFTWGLSTTATFTYRLTDPSGLFSDTTVTINRS